MGFTNKVMDRNELNTRKNQSDRKLPIDNYLTKHVDYLKMFQ